MLTDRKGVIHTGREAAPHLIEFASDTQARTLAEALQDADVFVGVSAAGVLTPQMLRTMAPDPIVFGLANPIPEIDPDLARSTRSDVILATGRSDHPNQVNNVLAFPYIFRGALDSRARAIDESMKRAATDAIAALAREPVTEAAGFDGTDLSLGRDYLIPKPFDPRVLWWVAPAVAEAAIQSGVARRAIDVAEYRERLAQRSSNAAYSILRGVVRAAKHAPKRIVYPEAENPKILRAVQTIVDEGLARPILLGQRDQIEAYCKEHDFDFLDREVEIVDPTRSGKRDEYAAKLWELRQRKGMTRGLARSLVSKSSYHGMMMVRGGEADGLVAGLTLTYPETIRPALQVLGLAPGVKVATSMYMMLIKDDVKFFADPTINIDPDAEVLADTAIQVSDAVAAMGIRPRVAMISFSNFGSVHHPSVDKVHRALALVRAQRPALEIDGEMQIDYAVDSAKRDEHFPFARLTHSANVLIFPHLSAANAAYQALKSFGAAQAVGPILLGIDKPVALLQNESTVDDIVTMTAHTVLMAQRYADLARG